MRLERWGADVTRRDRGRPDRRAVRVCTVHGLVQGVGFRPFVYALARELGLSGCGRQHRRRRRRRGRGTREPTSPSSRAGSAPTRRRWPASSRSMAAETASCRAVPTSSSPIAGGCGRARWSRPTSRPATTACAELADPGDRRYRHPFISCTNCGPRFTIVVDLPYDRPATTMARRCRCARAARREYADPADRRFHAQTVACPRLRPTLTLRHRRRRTTDRRRCRRRGAPAARRRRDRRGQGHRRLPPGLRRRRTRSRWRPCASARTAATSRSP